jgi:hypothetical protein
MSEDFTTEVVELVPIPPMTVETVQREVEKYIEQGLRESGKSELLKDGKISVAVEDTFPTAEAVQVFITIAGPIATETFRQVILPWLKKKFETRAKGSKSKTGSPRKKTG